MPISSRQSFFEKGWCRFSYDPVLANWVEKTLPSARAAVVAPENARWLRCGDTWFAGVNVLPNDPTGAVAGGPAIGGDVIDFIINTLDISQIAWDRAQVSVCYSGYPQPMAAESDASHRFRRDRDAAHLDGLLPMGVQRRRHLRECHGFVLGIPMVEASSNASPFVIWEGSHELIRAALSKQFEAIEPSHWTDIDMTGCYHRVRQKIFETCKRVEIHARPGGAYLIHRFALHGVAPWLPTATAGPDGRMIVYFRPEISSAERWLSAP